MPPNDSIYLPKWEKKWEEKYKNMDTTNKPLVVVADDEAMCTLMFGIHARKFGLNLIDVNDGDELEDLFKYSLGNLQERKIDFILSDIKMQRMSGIEAISSIKNIEEQYSKIDSNYSSPYIMVMTGFNENSIKDAVKAGAAFGLEKPLSPNILKVIKENWPNLDGIEDKIRKVAKPTVNYL